MQKCQICSGSVEQFFDFGKQPLSDAFVSSLNSGGEFFFRLAVGTCEQCTMVQLTEEVPRTKMFHEGYPYRSSGSATMRQHFSNTALQLIETELTSTNPFIVEVGSNDGVMLRTINEQGIRHLGVEPSGGVAEVARTEGINVETAFFEKSSAARIASDHGPANVVYAANTMCHIPYMKSIFEGIDALLADDGVFVFEDPYLSDILRIASFDQIYDEHFYFFSVHSVRVMAQKFGFELVDAEWLPVHGGELRYYITRPGRRTVTPRITELLAREEQQGLPNLETLQEFAKKIERNSHDLRDILSRLGREGQRVVAYGATAKSATVANYCGIGPDLVSAVYDTTPAKQGLLTPGMHIPVRPMAEFGPPYPDYALLFAWNFAEEIIAKERAYHESGGKWILYVPDVHVV